MSDNKKYADINNLNRFWSNAKEYIDASVSGGCIIPEYNHTGRYDLKQNKFYKLGIKDHLEIYLDYEYSETAPKYSFQFMSGSVPTNIRINGVSDHGSRRWSDPMNETYCIYNVNVLGNVVSVKKAYYNHYLTLEAIEDTTFTFSQTGTGTIQYSLDGGYTWNVGSEVTVKAGEQVMWKGNLTCESTSGLGDFNSTGKYCASGNIMSLLYEDDFEGKTDLTGYANAFSGMFGNASISTSTQNLMSVSNLELPATTLAASCYMRMFENCTNIKSSPVLPATTLAGMCYAGMFMGCTSLNKITALYENVSAFSLANWTNGVSSTGTFYKSSNYTDNSGIPSGWEVLDYVDPNYTCRPYLTTTLLSEGKISFLRMVAKDVEYSIDEGKTWNGLDVDALPMMTGGNFDNIIYTPTYPAGTKIMWRASINESRLAANGFDENGGMDHLGYFVTDTNYDVSGHILSLVHKDDFETNTEATINDIDLITPFYSIFGYVNVMINGFDTTTGVVNASELILCAKLTDDCYNMMFAYCTKLISAPELPATTLTDYCYNMMFAGCSSLTSAPELPATTLTESCYDGMFQSCSSLTSAPALPATTLTQRCYESMFQGCESLTSAPALPAMTLTYYCYHNMFHGCTSLTSAPTLPATTLAERCYQNMFYDCTSLISAPTLPATTLANSCYDGMFHGCTSLTSAPTLPATTLTDYCYSSMFSNCASLTSAPTLPAMTLTDGCYQDMFAGCSSLITAPKLPATTLADYCYRRMFYNCTSLNSITMLAPDINADYCLYEWVYNVASTGTFTKATSMTELPTGTSGIPSGWTVVNK